jgi:hypothetical protein
MVAAFYSDVGELLPIAIRFTTSAARKNPNVPVK